jgi:hypothetical protein
MADLAQAAGEVVASEGMAVAVQVVPGGAGGWEHFGEVLRCSMPANTNTTWFVAESMPAG